MKPASRNASPLNSNSACRRPDLAGGLLAGHAVSSFDCFTFKVALAHGRASDTHPKPTCFLPAASTECLPVMMKASLICCCLLLIVALSFATSAQDKRNGRPDAQPSPGTDVPKQNEKPASSAVKYIYEFNQPDFVVSHVVLEHDSTGRGNVT